MAKRKTSRKHKKSSLDQKVPDVIAYVVLIAMFLVAITLVKTVFKGL